jgi:two-component system, NtrC family, sensor kinase
MANDDRIEYVVGAEKRLTDILSRPDVTPLLQAALRAGAAAAELVDDQQAILWAAGSPPASGFAATVPLVLEGEPVGAITVRGVQSDREQLSRVAEIVHAAVAALLRCNLKRMLTTETHTTVVNQSYQDLLETNKRLARSEARYRDLAESLELKVRERTRELGRAHARLLQQEKMASVGQLAAGIAHEINNPLGFITSNLVTFGKYTERLRDMLAFYRTGPTEAQARERWNKLKLDFVLTDAGELLSQSVDGAKRVSQIVADLRGFSHIDDGPETAVDVNDELDRTLSILSQRIPGDAEIVRRYGKIPPLVAHAALLCQVFFNIVQNALQARTSRLRLVIATEHAAGSIRIAFADNGPGVPKDLRGRIFEPFFTTRDVGQGTGMGLAVSYDIVQAAGGSINVGDNPGGGALFTITLPVTGAVTSA